MLHSLKQLFTSGALTLVSALLLTGTVAADPSSDAPRVMGVGSCAASNCHGSVKPLKGSDVLQNEYYTWLKHDKHSRAFASLSNREGRRMADNLGIDDPTKEPLCLRCHATYVPDTALRGERYQVEDGVSCESCHGAAEKWLSEHAESDATHEGNVSRGLANTVSLPERAHLCLSCHQGDHEKWVDHDLYGAGHPRLSFELDTFGVLQPRHWEVDQDYVQRKGVYVPLRSWLVGQVVQARRALAVLRSPERSTKGNFPELSLFDCFSCHHNLSEKQWQTRVHGGRPGRLKLNLPSLVVLQQALEVFEPQLASVVKSNLKTLHDSYQMEGASAAIVNLEGLVDGRLTEFFSRVSPDEVTCRSLAERLGSYAVSAPGLTYEVAEQLAMGLQAVLASAPPLRSRYRSDLDALFVTLKSVERFDSSAFSRSARSFLKMGRSS